jgi:hypothetical protein
MTGTIEVCPECFSKIRHLPLRKVAAVLRSCPLLPCKLAAATANLRQNLERYRVKVR